MSSTPSSRRYQQSQKPVIIYTQESSNSRTSDSTLDRASASYYSSSRSDRSNMSSNYSSSRSDASHEPDRVYKFRAYDAGSFPPKSAIQCKQFTNAAFADNFEGTYKYSHSDKIMIINHNASRNEDPKIIHSSHATSGDYRRTQQRYEKQR